MDMSLVSNYTHLMPADFNIKNKSVIDFDLADQSFAKLLDEQISRYGEQNNWLSLFGIQATKPILDSNEAGFNIHELVSSANPINNYAQKVDINPIQDVSASEMMTFMSSPFDSHNIENHNNNFFDFIRKNAADTYNKCASNVITNLSEFIKGAVNN